MDLKLPLISDCAQKFFRGGCPTSNFQGGDAPLPILGRWLGLDRLLFYIKMDPHKNDLIKKMKLKIYFPK